MSRAVFLISSLSRICPAFLLLFVTGCGFQPLYGKPDHQTMSPLLVGIEVEPISGRVGQIFTTKLEDQLNPSGRVPSDPRYRLKANLVTNESAIGVARDGTVSRYNVYLDSTYELIRNSDGQRMTYGSLRHVSSYNNITNQYYSTYVAQEDAYKRGVAELALIYRQRLGAYLGENNGNPPIHKDKEVDLPPVPNLENSIIRDSVVPPVSPYNTSP